MRHRLAIAIFSVSAAILPAAHSEAQDSVNGCVGIHMTIIKCNSSGFGDDCECLTFKNLCTFSITVQYTDSSAGRLSYGLRRGESSTGVCTSRPQQTLNYVGWSVRRD